MKARAKPGVLGKYVPENIPMGVFSFCGIGREKACLETGFDMPFVLSMDRNLPRTSVFPWHVYETNRYLSTSGHGLSYIESSAYKSHDC